MDQKVLDRALKLFVRLINYSQQLQELLQKQLLQDQYLDSLFLSFFDRSEARLPKQSSLHGKLVVDDAHTLQRFASKVFQMMMGYRQTFFNFKVLKHDFLLAFYSQLQQYINPLNHSKFLRVVLLLLDRYLAYLRLATDYIQENRQSPLFRAQALTQQRLQFQTIIAQNFRQRCLKQNLLPSLQQANQMNLRRVQNRQKTIKQIKFQVCRTCGESFLEEQLIAHISRCNIRKRTIKKSMIKKSTVLFAATTKKQKTSPNKPKSLNKMTSFKSFKSLRSVVNLKSKQTCKAKAKSQYQIPFRPSRHYFPLKRQLLVKKISKPRTYSEPQGVWVRGSQFEPGKGDRVHKIQREQVSRFFVNRWLFQ